MNVSSATPNLAPAIGGRGLYRIITWLEDFRGTAMRLKR
jgi:hypothetical protein